MATTPKVGKAQVAIVMGIVTTVAGGVWFAAERNYDELQEDCRCREEYLTKSLEHCNQQILHLLAPREKIIEPEPIAIFERVEAAFDESVGAIMASPLAGPIGFAAGVMSTAQDIANTGGEDGERRIHSPGRDRRVGDHHDSEPPRSPFPGDGEGSGLDL